MNSLGNSNIETLIHAAVVTLFAASTAQAQQAVQWRVQDGGNGHWYGTRAVVPGDCWNQSRATAEQSGGYLATITSAAENTFLTQLLQQVSADNVSVGGYKDLQAGVWRWVTNEPWVFTNWQPGEPGCCAPDEWWLDLNRANGNWRDRVQCVGSSYTGAMLIEWSADCNNDGIVDYGQILTGQLPDANSNGVPDSCETIRVPADFPTIQAAVNAAFNGFIILVAPGSYAPFNFNGKRITVQSTNGATATTIDASGQRVSAVVFGIGASFDTTLRGFTIETGNAGGGGGVFLNGDGTPAGNCDGTIEDCRFIRGTGTVGYGGGLYAEYGNVVVRRCVFDGLYAQHFHGAMGIAMTSYTSVPGLPGVSVLVEDCEIRNCNSWNSGGVGVRGIQSSRALFRRVLFTGNSSPFSTGALITGTHDTAVVLQLDVDRCVFSGNSGPFSSGISEGLPLPGTFAPMVFNISGSIFADTGTSIVTRGSSQLRVQGTRFCAGTGAIGSPYTDLGGNAFSCATPTDCDSDGLPDAFAIALGRVADINVNGIPDPCEQPTCRNADLLADRYINGADLGILLSQWGPNTPLTESDLNNDGVVNGADLGLLLYFWGACP